MDFWYLRFSQRHGARRYLCGFLTPPVAGADLRPWSRVAFSGFATCFFVFVRCCLKAREILVLVVFVSGTLSHQSVVFLDRWRLETNERITPTTTTSKDRRRNDARASDDEESSSSSSSEKESEETRRFRRRRRRRLRVARVFETKRVVVSRRISVM